MSRDTALITTTNEMRTIISNEPASSFIVVNHPQGVGVANCADRGSDQMPAPRLSKYYLKERLVETANI